MTESDQFLVEVAYAKPDSQIILSCQVPTGTTVQQAIALSGVIEKFPEIDLTVNKVGIFGRLVKLDSEVNARDRVEIYRALIADPKESRRKRAEKKAKTE